jgi:O-succinylbenzoic acid--CoA ligase
MQFSPDWVAMAARQFGDRPALRAGGRRLSFLELDRLVGQVASALNAIITPQMRHVALLSANSVEMVAALFAIGRLGRTAILLNTRLIASEWHAQLAQFGPAFVITSGALRPAFDASPHGFMTCELEALLAGGSEGLSGPSIDLTRDQAVMFTSGTSGRPKAVPLTWTNHLYSAMASSWRVGHLPTDVWLTPIPLFHVGGLGVLIRSVLSGFECVLYERFDPSRVNADLDHNGTLLSVVPTMLARLLDDRGNRPFADHVRHLLVGGAAMPAELLERCRELAVPLATTYGLTEADSQVATLIGDDVYRYAGSSGRPLAFTSLRIVNEGCDDVALGETGQILVHGPTIMRGYLNESTTGVREGWLMTGDLGYVDELGNLFVIQRRSDLIISGGENIYPAEVEAVLREHPAVAEVAIVAQDDSQWGQVPAAVLTFRPGSTVSASELDAWCLGRLARFKRPRRYVITTEFPLTSTGKMDRARLAELAARLPSLG